jgi:hypothetical protein
VSAPWVAYIVVVLAVSMIVILGIALMSLSGKNIIEGVPKSRTKKDA